MIAASEPAPSDGGDDTHRQAKNPVMKFRRCCTMVIHFLRDQAGATSVEYGVMLALITATVFGSVVLVGGATAEDFRVAAQMIRDAFDR